MALIGIRGSSRSVNRALLLYAFERTPALILDCANCANPHALFPKAPFEKFDSVFVVEIEVIYSFRDALKRVPLIAEQLEIRCIVITTFNRLFDYGDEREKHEIFEHSWELMKSISASYEVVVGVHDAQEKSASKYCDKLQPVVHLSM